MLQLRHDIFSGLSLRYTTEKEMIMKSIRSLLTAGMVFSAIMLVGIGTCRVLFQRSPLLKLPSSPQRSLHGHDIVAYVAFSANGKMLATGSDDKTAKIWDPITGKILFTLTGHTEGLYFPTFSPDSKTLATCASDGTPMCQYNVIQSTPTSFSTL